MNLVYVVKRFPKFSETFVLREIEEVRRQGDRVVVCSLTRPHPGEPRHAGADDLAAETLYLPEGARRAAALAAGAVAALATRRGAFGALGWCLAWCLRERTFDHLKRFGEACALVRRLRDVDHVHAHFAHGPATVALLLGRLLGCPFSFTGHAKDIFQIVRPDLLAAKAAEARFVVAVSEYTREHVAATVAPGDRRKVVVVRNGVDGTRFAPRQAEPNGTPLLLSVARLVEKKGVDTLIEAVAELTARGIDVRCEIVGEGPRRAKVERLVRERGVAHRVMLAGSRDQDGVREAYERAAVFVLPARRTPKGDQDGLPVALVEALRVGVPVVSTPVSGIPEVVRDGETGLLVPPGDAGAVASAVQRLLVDEALRRRVVEGGRGVAEEYDLPGCVARLRTLFRDGPGA